MNRKSQKEIQVTTHMVRQFLQENEDTGYRDFHSNLLPGVDNVMGIRLPVLRKFAKQLSGMDWQEWFEQADDQWYEETMLRGLVSAYAKMECKERLTYVAKFVPDINNWAVCDCFCSTLKDADKYQTEYWDFIETYFTSNKEYEARFAAEDFHNRLQIPFIELRRLYQIDKIENQYHALGNALGVTFHDEEYKKQAENALEKFRKKCPDASFAIGECLNADPFELSLALIRYGFSVPEIYGTITVENFTYIRSLAKISPETKVFSNMEPTMIYYDPAKSGVNLAIGKDACYYHPDCPYVMWNGEEQPYGYAGVRRLFEQLLEVVQ